MQMEEQDARLIQGVFNLSEDEVRQITRVRRSVGEVVMASYSFSVAWNCTGTWL